MKKLLMIIAVFTLGFAIAACDDASSDASTRNGQTDNGDGQNDETDNGELELLEFTLEELSQYDGLEGRDAYVAVDGYVYDVTDSSWWRDGNHRGQVQAGQDLTDEMDANTRHGREMLDRVPKIGVLVEENETE